MLFAITSFLFDLIQAKRSIECRSPRKECDWYICADSRYVDCRRGKRCDDYDFCSTSSSTSSTCHKRRHPRKKCKDSSTSCSSTSTSCSSNSTSSDRHSRKIDALVVIEQILACEALEVKFKITETEEDLIEFTQNTLNAVKATLPGEIEVLTLALADKISALVTEEEGDLEGEIQGVIASANDAFVAAAFASIEENEHLALSQIHHLAKRDSSVIVREIRDSHHGFAETIVHDFENINASIRTSYPDISKTEIDTITGLLQGFELTITDKIAAEVLLTNLAITALVGGTIAEANEKIKNETINQFKNLKLTLDLLFCETGHSIVNIVKQVYGGKKVEYPKKRLCLGLSDRRQVQRV